MMRYWGILFGKLALVAAFLSGAWIALHAFWPEPNPAPRYHMDPFATDLAYTMALMMLWLVGVGLVYLTILDQRYRCRVCGRRLHMPVSSGGWNSLLLRSPRTDYICRFGHGTLRVPEVDLSGTQRTDWEPIEDMWKELEELETADK